MDFFGGTGRTPLEQYQTLPDSVSTSYCKVIIPIHTVTHTTYFELFEFDLF